MNLAQKTFSTNGASKAASDRLLMRASSVDYFAICAAITPRLVMISEAVLRETDRTSEGENGLATTSSKALTSGWS